MISKQDKQAILNGAYGITNNNRKVRYLGENTHYHLALKTLREYQPKGLGAGAKI